MALSLSIPSTLRAGTTWAWEQLIPDYAGWAAVCAFRNGAAHFDVAGSGSGETFAFSAAVSATAARIPGEYTAILYVSRTEGGILDRREIGSTTVLVLPDLSAAAAVDTRSTLRKILDAIDAALLNRATSDQLDLISTQFEGRSQTRDKSSLIELRRTIQIELSREDAAGRGRAVNLGVRFR
jgi:hypothetical protein